MALTTEEQDRLRDLLRKRDEGVQVAQADASIPDVPPTPADPPPAPTPATPDPPPEPTPPAPGPAAGTSRASREDASTLGPILRQMAPQPATAPRPAAPATMVLGGAHPSGAAVAPQGNGLYQPRQIPLPTPPKPEYRDPLMVLGQPLTALALLASAFTRKPLTAAMMALGTAAQAQQQGDKDRYAASYREYEMQLQRANAEQMQENEHYQRDLDNKKLDLQSRLARIRATAGRRGDTTMQNSLDAGVDPRIILKARLAAGKPITEGLIKLAGARDLQDKDDSLTFVDALDLYEQRKGDAKRGDTGRTMAGQEAKAVEEYLDTHRDVSRAEAIRIVKGRMSLEEKNDQIALKHQQKMEELEAAWDKRFALEEKKGTSREELEQLRIQARADLDEARRQSREDIARDNRISREQEGEANRTSREGITDKNIESRERVAEGNRESREKIAADKPPTKSGVEAQAILDKAEELRNNDKSLSKAESERLAIEAINKARGARGSGGAGAGMSGNMRVKLEESAYAFEESLDKIDSVLSVLNNYRMSAGLAGSALRGKEIVTNIFGVNDTDREQMKRNIDFLQSRFPRLMSGGGRPLASEDKRTASVVAGLGLGDTTYNTIRAMEELRSVYLGRLANTQKILKEAGRGADPTPTGTPAPATIPPPAPSSGVDWNQFPTSR